MNAKEFRLGNWITYKDVKYQIFGLNKELPFVDSEEFMCGVIDFNNIKPIKITDDILAKLGFIAMLDYSYSHEIIGGWFEMSKHNLTLNMNGSNLKSVQYVHELQNLIYALTGSELSLSST